MNMPLRYTLPNEHPISLIRTQPAKLYLGNLDSAMDLALLEKLNIAAVLSICTEEDVNYKQMKHLKITIHDQPHVPITEQFKKSFEFIDKALLRKENILVHCAAGISRSATVLIAYLMQRDKRLLEDILREVKSQRSFVRPNPGFLKQLLDFERSLFGEVYSHLSQELTPFQVQNEARYKAQMKKRTMTSTKPLIQVYGNSTSKKLTKVPVSIASFQPSAFKI